ncbi:hypothetical protein ACXGQW_01655 [Wenyingzhuangia sp. IMCC45533]
MKKNLVITRLGLVLILSILLFVSCKDKAASLDNHYSDYDSERAPYLKFPTPLSPETPWDVDRKLQKKLTDKGKFSEVQRMFEILSWQWFVSLNWPTDDKGHPKDHLSDDGTPEWFKWKESYEVFRPNGEKPTPWGTFNYPIGFPTDLETNNAKILFRSNKFVDFTHPDIDDEIDQAFTGPIWDQNGNITRYEVRMNQVEFDYILKHELYNYDGQIEFSKTTGDVNFPEGNRTDEGVIEIKVAWKVLEESDIKSRYFSTKGYVISQDGTYTKKDVGMVGMHISSKTESAPQWIWTTFEHIDNLEVNELDVIDGKPLKASYYDANNPTAAINVFPDTVGVAKPKTQIQRVLPISEATKELNISVRSILREANSKLQYYQQIGTQWPTNPSSKPYTYGGVGGAANDTIYTLPASVTNKSGGMPTPVYLTNMVMETYFQGGTIVGDGDQIVQTFQRKDTNGKYKTQHVDTLQGYDIYMANEPAYFQMNGGPMGYDTANSQKIIFGTESCIGCHFSSNIATGYTLDTNGNKIPVFDSRPSSADFSWLLNQKPSFLPAE